MRGKLPHFPLEEKTKTKFMTFNYSNHFLNLTEPTVQYNDNLHFSYKIFPNNDEEFRN